MTPQQVIMQRRLSAGLRVFAAIVCALLLDAGDARAEATSAPARHINAQRLQVTLEKLSEFGRNPEGGVTRLGFSQTELDARTYVIGYEGCRARGSRRPAGIAPMGMIYVPIRDGISHSPQEFMSWEDCANGVEVLYRSILLLDRRLQPD